MLGTPEDESLAARRHRKVRQRMTLPYEAVLDQVASGRRRATPVAVETAVFCTAVLERVCCALLQAATESAQDEDFWQRRGSKTEDRITPRYIQLAVRRDPEFQALLSPSSRSSGLGLGAIFDRFLDGTTASRLASHDLAPTLGPPPVGEGGSGVGGGVGGGVGSGGGGLGGRVGGAPPVASDAEAKAGVESKGGLAEAMQLAEEEANRRQELAKGEWQISRQQGGALGSVVTDVDLSNVMKKVHPGYSLSHDAIVFLSAFVKDLLKGLLTEAKILRKQGGGSSSSSSSSSKGGDSGGGGGGGGGDGEGGGDGGGVGGAAAASSAAAGARAAMRGPVTGGVEPDDVAAAVRATFPPSMAALATSDGQEMVLRYHLQSQTRGDSRGSGSSGSSGKVRIRVRNHAGGDHTTVTTGAVTCGVQRRAPLGPLLVKICRKFRVEPKNTVFVYNGKLVKEGHTPASLGMTSYLAADTNSGGGGSRSSSSSNGGKGGGSQRGGGNGGVLPDMFALPLKWWNHKRRDQARRGLLTSLKPQMEAVAAFKLVQSKVRKTAPALVPNMPDSWEPKLQLHISPYI